MAVTANRGALLGLIPGLAYFGLSEAGRPKEVNCSYLAPASTDIMAFAAAAILYWQARKLKNPWIGGVAGAIAAIHVGQLVHYKIPRRTV